MADWLGVAGKLQRQLDEVTRERDEALAQVTKSQAEVDRLTPPELTKKVEAILDWLFRRATPVSEGEMGLQTRVWGLKDQVAQYHIDKLREGNSLTHNIDTYFLSSRGRAHVMENGLDKGAHQ